MTPEDLRRIRTRAKLWGPEPDPQTLRMVWTWQHQDRLRARAAGWDCFQLSEYGNAYPFKLIEYGIGVVLKGFRYEDVDWADYFTLLIGELTVIPLPPKDRNNVIPDDLTVVLRPVDSLWGNMVMKTHFLCRAIELWCREVNQTPDWRSRFPRKS